MGTLRQFLWWGQLAGCYLFVLFSPFWTSAAEAALALALLCWVLDWFFEFPRPFPVSFLLFPTVVFLLVLIFSALFGFSFSRSLVFISKQWVFLALFFFALRLKYEPIRRKVFSVFGISVGLVALYSILQTFTGWHLGLGQHLEPVGQRFRSTGFFPVVLTFGLYFALMAIAFLAWGWPKRKMAAGKFFIAISALSYLVVLFNAGRAGILSVCAGFIFWLFLSRAGKKLRLLAGAAALTLIAWAANPAIFSRFGQFKGYEFEASAKNRRLAIWHRSYEIFQDHPIFGVGPDNFKAVYAKKIKGISAKPLGHAHNDFLNVLVYAGLFGLAAFIFFWKELAFRLWENFRQNRASPYLLMGVLVLAAYLLYAQFESSLVYREIRMVLFFLLGAALAGREPKTA